jgi:predicted DNA binding CopG/RHH family protein
MAKNKSSISYGKKDLLSADDFKNPKIRISMMVDEDLLQTLKRNASEEGIGYQTLMQKILRESVGRPSLEERVRRLEKKLG